MAKMKVTVVKRLNNKELFGDDPPLTLTDAPLCPRFTEGQEFVFDPSTLPQGFCPWAYADIYRAICHLRFGGDFPWLKEKKTMLSSCTDGARPVIFKLELLEE